MNETTVLDRAPPHNLLTEQSVTGIMILSKNVITDVYQTLQTADFYGTKHQVVFDTIMDLYSTSDSIDLLTLISALEKIGKLGQIGGLGYIYTLTHVVPTYTSVSYYAEVVRDKITLHGLVEVGTRITQLGWAFDEGDAKDLINTVHQKLDRVSQRRTSEDYKALKDLIPQVTIKISSAEPDPNMVYTGFHDFDMEIQGLRPGWMIVAAARPGMEKPTFSLDIYRYAAIYENKIATVFLLEVSYAEAIKRLISTKVSALLSAINAGVSSADGAQSQTYRTNIADATNRTFEKSLYIDDSVNPMMPETRARCRRLKYSHNPSIAVVDYLQLMRGRGSAEPRQQKVFEVSCSLKLLAKELEIPIIAVTQLSRSSESRTDKRPMMNDLQESGSLEQDVGMVLLLHRSEAYSPDDRPGEADLYTAKHRNNRIGAIHPAFQGALSRFVDTARVDPGDIPLQEEY